MRASANGLESSHFAKFQELLRETLFLTSWLMMGTDGDPVPVPHFGLAMSVPDFHALADRVRAAGIQFIIEPHIRFSGQPGEQVAFSFHTHVFHLKFLDVY